MNASFARVLIRGALMASVSVFAAGLNACSLASKADPGIEFSTVPPADHGGPDKLGPIAGRVKGARPNQRIVLFARSGSWWVQPFRSKPFTTIEKDSTWKSTIHLGTEYAALLVEPDYHPPVSLDALPPAGGSIAAIAVVKGSGSWIPPTPKTVSFSGYDWDVVQVSIDRHGANVCDARNVWVDGEGHLHLLLTQRDGRLTSAALTLSRPLGYGTYAFTVRDISHLDPAAALVMYTWDDRADLNHRELNISLSRWGDPRNKNGQYVLQYEDVAANVYRFAAPAGALTHAFRWEPGSALFRTVRGTEVGTGQEIAERQFTSGVPAPATATARICLLYVREAKTPLPSNVEVVVERFVFLP
jgi:hypothetical protein